MARGREVTIPLEHAQIAATLGLPAAARGLVIFAHGSGSSRFSSRNRAVAELLQQHRLATLLIDLLTEEEAVVDERTRQYRFDIPRLAARVVAGIAWAKREKSLQHVAGHIGLFGASTGAAAALIAAAECPLDVEAVVSRGGRPDLAENALPKVKAPTLLIVGADDDACIPLNESAYRGLSCEKKLELVPGATHLFEEPGTLRQAADLAAAWFVKHLGGK
ncbi:MAG: dienelactone hydrolase family protein [Turneriella sp.]